MPATPPPSNPLDDHAARLAEHVRKSVAGAPPLPTAQKLAIARLVATAPAKKAG